MSAKQKATVIFCLSLVGVVNAALLSSQYLSGDIRSICGSSTGCSDVLTSKYSHLFGIPLAFFGLGMYSVLLLFTHFSLSTTKPHISFSIIDKIALVGTVSSAVLMYIQAFVLKAFCPFCTLSALLIALIWVFSGAIRKSLLEEQTIPSRPSKPLMYASYALVIFLFSGFVYTLTRDSFRNSKVVARIGTEVLNEDTMNESLKMTISENQSALYQAKRSWIEGQLAETLLRKEAEKRNLSSTDALVENEVNSKVGINDSDVIGYYKKYYAGSKEPLEKVQEKIRQYLLQQKRGERKSAFVDYLKGVYHTEILLAPPQTAVFKIDVEGSYVLGAANAPITMVIFTDFQCPYCAQVAQEIYELEKSFTGKLRIILKHYPLEMHEMAEIAAECAECAGEQGKFWQYHDYLFANQDKLDTNFLRSSAIALGISVEKFQRCLESHKDQNKIIRDKRQGDSIGVRGTPTIFINGRPLFGNLSLADMKKEIELAIVNLALANKGD